MADNNIQREIEDILNRLDKFVPEESAASRIRRRSSGSLAVFIRSIFAPFTRISLRHVMLTALLLVFVGFFARRVSPVATWVLVAGLILFLTAFALSFVSRSSGSTEKNWRGRTIELNEPSLAERLKAWFNSGRRPRY